MEDEHTKDQEEVSQAIQKSHTRAEKKLVRLVKLALYEYFLPSKFSQSNFTIILSYLKSPYWA